MVSRQGGYRHTQTFAYVCLVYYATEVFCSRNFTNRSDPLGVASARMIGAARSVRQHVIEGFARAAAPKETEPRPYEAAKSSLAELAGEYESFLVGGGIAPWSVDDESAFRLGELQVDAYDGDMGENARHDYGEYILAMRRRFEHYLESRNPVVAANSAIVVIDRICSLISRPAAAEESRDAKVAAGTVPTCPKCGKPMRKTVARKGRNAGNLFWSCTGYPDCDGTRKWSGG